ncbi:MAG: hypothetical protein CM15mP83_1020 [Flavobacteriaceae bacterium]|nr:MAG: hypothetical protein CM15mP83_1020 [Flavobacteriaceae bacterium]
MYEQKRNEIQQDLKRSIDIIQSITGKKLLHLELQDFRLLKKQMGV